MKLNQIDYLIIQELSNDARQTATSIAQKINSNERTVRRHINILIENDVIRTTTIINPSFFGYKSIVDINIKVEEEYKEEFINYCTSHHSICYVALGWGEANVSIEARFKGNDEMYNFIESVLPQLKGVKVINYFIIPKIIQNIDKWLPLENDFINN